MLSVNALSHTVFAVSTDEYANEKLVTEPWCSSNCVGARLALGAENCRVLLAEGTSTTFTGKSAPALFCKVRIGHPVSAQVPGDVLVSVTLA